MKRSTKVLGVSAGFLAAAAFSGLIGGATARASTSSGPGQVKTVVNSVQAGTSARISLDGHDCKNMNSCKGQGGCKSGDQGCKGKNSCSGKGGCNTNTPKSL